MAEEHRLRNHQLRVWLVDEEKQLLVKNAYELGLSQSEYVRQLIVYGGLIGRQWTMDEDQGKQLLYELNRIGNNLNQIAYNTNAKKYASNEDWKNVKENYFEFLSLFGKIPFLDEGVKDEWQQQISTLLHKL